MMNINNDPEIQKAGNVNKVNPVYAVRDNGEVKHCQFDEALYHFTNCVFDRRIGLSDIFAGIKKVGIIGGTLSSGGFWNGQSIVVNKIFAWYQTLARESGMTYIDFCGASMKTRNWFTDSEGYAKAIDKDNICNAYYVWIGEDDIFDETIELGSVADVDLSDYTNNADTYYGNYAKIIQCLTEKNAHAKFFLITNPYNYDTSDAALYNTAVRDIASLFDNCYVLDLELKYSYMFLGNNFFANVRKHGFYPAYAYVYIAKIIEYETGLIIAANPDDFYSEEYGDLLTEQLDNNTPVYTNNYMIDNPEYSSVVLDADNKVISGVKK